MARSPATNGGVAARLFVALQVEIESFAAMTEEGATSFGERDAFFIENDEAICFEKAKGRKSPFLVAILSRGIEGGMTGTGDVENMTAEELVFFREKKTIIYGQVTRIDGAVIMGQCFIVLCEGHSDIADSGNAQSEQKAAMLNGVSHKIPVKSIRIPGLVQFVTGKGEMIHADIDIPVFVEQPVTEGV